MQVAMYRGELRAYVLRGGGNYQSQFIQRGPLSRLVVIENVALVTASIDRSQSRSAGCFDFITSFFLRTRMSHAKETGHV